MTEEHKKHQRRLSRLKVTRDGVILTFAIVAASFEITLGGARPSVLTFLSGVFFSPFIMRIDERNRDRYGREN